MTGINFQILSACGGAATITATDNAVDTSDASTYTFTNRAIGTALTNRLIIVGVHGVNVTAARTISSLTIGGAGATQVAFSQTSGSGVFFDVGIYALRVDAGTTASIVVNWSAAQLRTGIGVWAANGVNSATATATASSAANPLSTTLNISAGGVALGYAAVSEAGGVPTYTWSGLTEAFDQTVEPNSSHTGASLAFAAAQTGLTITATPNIFTAGQMVLAAFR